jgi:hypothetical protein
MIAMITIPNDFLLAYDSYYDPWSTTLKLPGWWFDPFEKY